MPLSDQQNQSTLRQAVSRILGEPGSSPFGLAGGSGPRPSSEFNLGTPTSSTLSNTPYESPDLVAARQAVADAKAATAQMQAQLGASGAAPATPATPAVPGVSSAVPATPAAPAQMISRAGLYELQKQQQMSEYDRKKAEQVAGLRAAGMSDQQLGIALQPTNWGIATQPANWGSYANYMNTSMVPNPYATATTAAGAATPYAGGATAAPPTDLNALAEWKKTHAWVQGPGGQILLK